MNRVVLAIVLAACLVAVGHCLSTVAKKPPLRRKNAQSTGSQYLPFLMKLHLPSGMPKSYAVEPPNYFELVPASEKLDYYNHSYPSPQCNNQNVSAKRMNEYMFQTETLLTHLGLDIYDAAVWTIALSILGQADHAHNYTKNVLVADRTFQFTDIRGDHTCNGVMAWGQCTDPSQSGYCGFCYGDGAVTLTKTNAYFFRYISDYWAIEGTVDVRCPELNHMWIWNDYRPILGENAWAQLTGPAHNAMWRHNNTAMNIPDDDPIFALGIPFLDALETMQVGSTGAIFFAPWNTWFGFSHEAEDVAESFSIENQASTYAGLRSLYNILKNKTNSVHRRHLPRIKRLMVGLQKILLSSWNGQYFRQGGTYNSTTSKLAWHQGRSPDFAVDCQTWVGAALGVAVVDGAFGPLTSYNLWQFVKATAGYYSAGYLYGVGYTNNSYGGQVFSGEWTYGAINWVQVMIAEGGYNSTIVADLQNDVFNMQFGLETDLITRTYIHNSTEKYDSVMYANKRYYIPFGWFANNIPAMCSTAWAVLTDHNYNPFNINSGNYGYTDEFVRSMTEIRPDGAVEIKSHVLQEIEDMERGLRPAPLEHSKQHGRAGIN